MSPRLCFSFHSMTRTFGLFLLAFASTSITVHSQVTEKSRPVLDVEGNKIFSKQELLDPVNQQLDKWASAGSKYNSEQLDYCLHQLDNLIKSRGYLQGKVTRGKIDETEEGSRVVLSVKEGPLFRVGEIRIDDAQLFSPEQIRDEIGLKTGDIANREALYKGLYERLKTRYAKFGYIKYTADINPTFHVKEGASEGVVDFTIIIDEAEQFRVRSITIDGADRAATELLQRELLIRNGDILDDELVRESVKRVSSTGLVDPVEADKDVDYRQPDQNVPVMDLIIHVKRASRF
jgi:outer membrane protein insertion porin family